MTELLTQVFLPLSLGIIMLGMGMTLVPADFTRIFTYPKAVLIGLINQLVLLPLIGFALAVVFNLDPILAIGIMIIAACPGGPTSNLVTQVCRGNIALSVTLTAIASFITILTIPLILSFAIAHFGGDTAVAIKLPVLDTILQILVITVIPISIGMIIRKFKPAFANRMERPMRIASTVIFIIIFIAIIAANLSTIGDAMKSVGIVALLLNILTMGLGYLSARLFGLDFKNTISISIESGIQNGTLAIVIATTILNNIEMAVPAAAYSILMFATCGVLMWRLGSNPAHN
ncbi:MAG: bile acid:sodium symporter family protein [Gilvibacter sp.]